MALKGISMSVEPGEMMLVIGQSGSGKSTLAKVLAGLVPDFYGGLFSGRVLYKGRELREWHKMQRTQQIGFVFQDSERQLIFDQVEREIAFGLENLGLSRPAMHLRVAEVCDYLGIHSLLRRAVHELSGGERQKVALAGVLAMHPELLILDEPVSQLDPIAAEEFIQIVKRLNEERGITVIICEQRTERLFHIVDKTAVINDGRITDTGTPHSVAMRTARDYLLPTVPRLFRQAGWSASLPLSIREGRQSISRMADPALIHMADTDGNDSVGLRGPNVVSLNKVWVGYESGHEVLKDVSFDIAAGEIVGIAGGNGAGKSTLLKTISGLVSSKQGRVEVLGRAGRQLKPEKLAGQIGYLPQNPADMLWSGTVREELTQTVAKLGCLDQVLIDRIVGILNLESLLDANPRELSQGEQVRVALASIVSIKPQLLLLDEPTRGLDSLNREAVGQLIKVMALAGSTVMIVSHDTEFLADYVQRLLIMFDGQIVADGAKEEILRESVFYSPPAASIFRGIDDSILTQEQARKQLEQYLANNREDCAT